MKREIRLELNVTSDLTPELTVAWILDQLQYGQNPWPVKVDSLSVVIPPMDRFTHSGHGLGPSRDPRRS